MKVDEGRARRIPCAAKLYGVFTGAGIRRGRRRPRIRRLRPARARRRSRRPLRRGSRADRPRPPARSRSPRRSRCARAGRGGGPAGPPPRDRKSTRLNSSHVAISYAVFCLKKKKIGYLRFVIEDKKKVFEVTVVKDEDK